MSRVRTKADPVGSGRSDFAGWVSPYLADMHRLACRLAPGAPEDVVQDALVRAWRRGSTFDPARGTARTWLLALVAGEARRTRLRDRRVLQFPPRAAPAADVDRDLDLLNAVRSLPHRMRLAVELHYFVGLSVLETAEVMGVSQGTVKSTLHDARERLRVSLHVGEEVG